MDERWAKSERRRIAFCGTFPKNLGDWITFGGGSKQFSTMPAKVPRDMVDRGGSVCGDMVGRNGTRSKHATVQALLRPAYNKGPTVLLSGRLASGEKQQRWKI